MNIAKFSNYNLSPSFKGGLKDEFTSVFSDCPFTKDELLRFVKTPELIDEVPIKQLPALIKALGQLVKILKQAGGRFAKR